MKDYTQYKLNLLPSPPDKRDWIYENTIKDFIVMLPTVLDWRSSMFPVRDQGYQGSCAAMSGAAMKDWQEIKDVAIDEYMSPQFIYNNRYNQNSEGMTMRDLMSILKNTGDCRESLHVYGNKDKPSTNAYDDAKHYVIEAYASITTVEGLKAALYENGPCVIAVPVYNYTTRMWKQRTGDNLLGGHAMTIVGYNEEGFIIRNSWGDSWGDAGHTIFPYEDWGFHWEAWSAVDADSDPGPIPRKTWFEKYWWVVIGAVLITGIVLAFTVF